MTLVVRDIRAELTHLMVDTREGVYLSISRGGGPTP